jgi:hypothetical protein
VRTPAVLVQPQTADLAQLHAAVYALPSADITGCHLSTCLSSGRCSCHSSSYDFVQLSVAFIALPTAFLVQNFTSVLVLLSAAINALPSVVALVRHLAAVLV